MKKFLLILMVFANFMFANAQNYDTLYIQGMSQSAVFHYCANEYAGVVVYGEPNCNCQWNVNFGGYIYDESITLLNSEYNYYVTYTGFVSRQFNVFFHTSWESSPFLEPVVWKRYGESVSLRIESIYDLEDYELIWSNGSNNYEIEVSEPGIYSVTITSIYGCGSATYSVEVRDNVEIDLATCDLETNLNMVTWQTTTAQAEYVDHVIIKRDGLEVGTANYSDGFFLDNIGSDLSQRTYTVIAVDTDGSQCPIVSYPKETIHMAYLTGVNNTIEVNWNVPTGYDLLGYNICEWIPNGKDGELNVIDFVGASVTSYTCTESQFNNGHVVVQGVENGRTENRLLSNRSDESIMGVGELNAKNFKVYPNPTNGIFTVEGTGHLTVMNLLGQEILVQEIEGETTLELPKGMYFMRLGSATRKVVVE